MRRSLGHWPNGFPVDEIAWILDQYRSQNVKHFYEQAAEAARLPAGLHLDEGAAA
jgi:hypothetical protein